MKFATSSVFFLALALSIEASQAVLSTSGSSVLAPAPVDSSSSKLPDIALEGCSDADKEALDPAAATAPVSSTSFLLNPGLVFSALSSSPETTTSPWANCLVDDSEPCIPFCNSLPNDTFQNIRCYEFTCGRCGSNEFKTRTLLRATEMRQLTSSLEDMARAHVETKPVSDECKESLYRFLVGAAN